MQYVNVDVNKGVALQRVSHSNSSGVDGESGFQIVKPNHVKHPNESRVEALFGSALGTHIATSESGSKPILHFRYCTRFEVWIG